MHKNAIICIINNKDNIHIEKRSFLCLLLFINALNQLLTCICHRET